MNNIWLFLLYKCCLIYACIFDQHNNPLIMLVSRLATLSPMVRSSFSVKKIEVFINNKPYQVASNLSIFQAAKENGI